MNAMRYAVWTTLAMVLGFGPIPGRAAEGQPPPAAADRPYTVVDTGQDRCYGERGEIAWPGPGEPFFGQDAQVVTAAPAYRDNGDGTVTDRVTGLEWQKDPGAKKTFRQAVAGASACRTGGHDDWRLPTIKELYSLILFSGADPDPRGSGTDRLRPFIDADAFVFHYGDAERGERIIDSQFATCTKYVSTTMHGDETMFGVNFADGRIKGYGLRDPRGRGEKTFYVLYVRGNPAYGRNDFREGGDGTVIDRATGLEWMRADSGHLKAGPKGDGRLTWQEALAWAEELTYAGHDDWRLPSAKELQSLVDYTRSPDTMQSAAIDPVFRVTPIRNEGGRPDFPWYWTGTTHASPRGGSTAVYVAFGRSLGWMRDRRTGEYALLDVHGAGSQRSDPKAGDASWYPHGRGPQGDVIRIRNFARCVRGGGAALRTTAPASYHPVAETPPAAGAGPPEGGPEGEGPMGPSGEQFVRRLDRDGDGKVSRKEFDGPAWDFGRLDRSGDGYLSAEEAPRGPPPQRQGPPPRR